MCHFSQNLNEGTWRRFSSTRQPQYGFSMHSTLWTPSDIVDSMNERFGLMLRQDLVTLMNEGKAKSTCFKNRCKSTYSETLSLDSSEGSGGGFVHQALSDYIRNFCLIHWLLMTNRLSLLISTIGQAASFFQILSYFSFHNYLSLVYQIPISY